MDEQITARVDELQILLNLLAERGDSLTVTYPFYDLPIVTYNPLKGVVAAAVQDTEFDEARNKHLPKAVHYQDDLPGWADLRDALLTSGALTYANESAVRTKLADEQSHARHAHNPNPTFLAFDTNTLYNRLPARALHRFLPNGFSGFQFAVSEAVHNELDFAMTPKYTTADLQMMKAKLSHSRQVDNLFNRPKKKGRRAKLGLADVRRLEKSHRSIRCKADPLTTDKEQNDRIIARSYAGLRESARADVMMLTSDHNMQEHALAAGTKAVHLEMPKVTGIPTGPMDERVFCRLIHDLAVAWGALRFVGHDAMVWGEWRSKQPADSESDTLLIQHNGSDLLAGFAADLEVARKVESAALGL